MAARNEEITAVYLGEKHRWDDTVIIEVQPVDTQEVGLFGEPPIWEVKTSAKSDELEPHITYRFLGHWTNYTNKRSGEIRRQLLCSSWLKSAKPHGRKGVTRWLMQSPNIGAAIAGRLFDLYGGDAVRILRESPEAVAEKIGGQFSEEKAKEAAAYLWREHYLEQCSIELEELLACKGLPRSTRKKCIEEWGNHAADEVKANPFVLMRFRGCGFIRVDKLYLELGHDPKALERQSYCAWYAIAGWSPDSGSKVPCNNDGHTWLPKLTVEAGLRSMLGAGADVRPLDAVKIAIERQMLAARRDGKNNLYFAEHKKAAAERSIADKVAEMVSLAGEWPDVSLLDVSDHQRDELTTALTTRIAVFAGRPGTGKTYSAARLIAALIAEHGADSVAVAAPTGKAAVRITEVMLGYGVQIVARTIHSLLSVASESEGDGWSFEFNENNPLPFRYIVIDESSMLDTGLFCSLITAVCHGAHILFIGDTNQLPPVGHGAPLRDLIAAGVPTGTLTVIQRQGKTSRIVAACGQMIDRGNFDVSPKLDPDSGEDLAVIPCKTEHVIDKMLSIIANIGQRGTFNPVWDIQVICAVNVKGPLNRRDLNKRLQASLNPTGQSAPGNPFKVGDKIVCLKNTSAKRGDDNAERESFDDEEDDSAVFLANGELGEVLEVREKLIIAKFEPDRIVKIPRGSSDDGDEKAADDEADDKANTGCNFDLGYALSCHKTQGSEWPIVLIVLDEYQGARRICTREWIYTGISRGKKACLLIGQKATADQMCLRKALAHRKTFLVEEIHAAAEKLLQEVGRE